MKSMNRKEGKKIAVMAAIIVGFMMFAFMPAASATVTSFTVTPSTGYAGAVDSYNALVTTDAVTTINITIPAGFIAVAPTSGGVEIARVDFWNSSTKAHYGYATITANDTNPTTKVDIHCEFGGDAITTTQNVDYAASATNTFESPFGDGSLAIIKLPTVTQNGSINITISSTTFLLEDVYIAFRQFVRNPSVANVYNFYADGEVAPVNIHRQPLGDLAYLKKGPSSDWNYDLFIYTVPSTTGEHGTLIASDLWSPDGHTVGITAIDTDEIAYLKKGSYSDLDYNLFIYTAPSTIREHGTLIASDLWAPDGSTVAITAIDIDGNGIDEIAYLKKGSYSDLDYNLFIYTAPSTIREHGTLIASDLWAPDGSTVAITAIDIDGNGIDEIAYLKKGSYSDLDYNLFIYTAPSTIREHGTLIASDLWAPDGSTVAITAIDIDGNGIDEIAYLKKGSYSDLDYNLFIFSAPTTIREHGILMASDYWSPDGKTEDISALG